MKFETNLLHLLCLLQSFIIDVLSQYIDKYLNLLPEDGDLLGQQLEAVVHSLVEGEAALRTEGSY